jgi:cyclase
MQLFEVSPGVLACVRPDEGANVGLIRTVEGPVVVDTTSTPAEMQGILDAVGVAAGDVRLVINTHFHSDHVWGNQLFGCPILAHRLCREKMLAALANDWRPAAIAEWLDQLEKADPERARRFRPNLVGLRIMLPTETFDDRRSLALGGVRIEVIHLDSHTPDLSVVWLPEAHVLFASDLLFVGRYPYLFDADVPALIATLRRLPEFGGRVIVPGHGPLCGQAEVDALVGYLQATWDLTAEHLIQGHSADEAAADPRYPRYAEAQAERLHVANIKFMYERLAREKG